MKRYELVRGLLREAHRLSDVFLGEDIIELMGKSELAVSMARSSFIAHSIFAGHDRTTVERIAEHVFSNSHHPQWH